MDHVRQIKSYFLGSTVSAAYHAHASEGRRTCRWGGDRSNRQAQIAEVSKSNVEKQEIEREWKSRDNAFATHL